MSSHLLTLLHQWYPARERTHWVLGSVYQTAGPAYRKAGAIMLFGGDGQQLGMLSGGCLESDIHRHARRVMASGRTLTLTYDGSDEDDLAFQLGIGCGGTVRILLQPIQRDNDYLQLERVYRCLSQRRSGLYRQLIAADGTGVAEFATTEPSGWVGGRARLEQRDGQCWLLTPVVPPPHLLIAGGGIDARPLAALAHQLGWRVSVWDPRPANARPEYFGSADRLLGDPAATLAGYVRQQRVDAAVLMSHNVQLDADALRALCDSRLAYLALLGPDNRRQRVLAAAGVTLAALATPLAGPAGLDIGAELPETIALAILAECQAALGGASGRSLSGVLRE